MPEIDLARIADLVAGEDSAADRLYRICAYLEAAVAHFNWVGIYYAKPQEQMLILGPFVGAPTEHVRIPYGRGICGQVAVSMAPLIIQDVSQEDNYLACSLEVKSEIVVPIFYEQRFVGELDIDSHFPQAFTNSDQLILEQIATMIAPLVARISNF